MRLIYTLVLLLLTSLVYGQKSILFHNVNYRAFELKHHLNDAEDHIILNCEREIIRVNIYNNDFEQVINVREKNTKIPIYDIPIGRYVLEVVLKDKIIVITLVRHETLTPPHNASLIASITNPEPPKLIQQTSNTINTESTENLTSGISKNTSRSTGKGGSSETVSLTSQNEQLSLTKKSNIENINVDKPVKAYWIYYKSHVGTRSEKILRLGDKKLVDRLIKKIEIDMKTETGKLNELAIWEVYDPPAFIKHKFYNKENYTDLPSGSFNLIPYYKQLNSLKTR